MAGGSALNITRRDLPGGEERLVGVRRGRALQYLTIAWNSGECVIALTAGFLAGGMALVGFGLDLLSRSRRRRGAVLAAARAARARPAGKAELGHVRW